MNLCEKLDFILYFLITLVVISYICYPSSNMFTLLFNVIYKDKEKQNLYG